MNEIETILCKLFDCDRSGLYLGQGRKALSGKQLNRLENILAKRASGEPLQYIIGDVEFMGLKIRVAPGVLIPRPETELLVEAVAEYVSNAEKKLDILDIGTGSGNIPIALAAGDKKERLNIFAVDISDICLKKARSNARLNKVGDRITFLKSDIFSCFDIDRKFDCIVSNPPYIAIEDFHGLPQDVQMEPSSALLARDSGFYFYKRIEAGACKHLLPGGKIFLEIGYGQSEGVKDIFGNKRIWCGVKILKDYNKIDRVVIIERAGRLC